MGRGCGHSLSIPPPPYDTSAFIPKFWRPDLNDPPRPRRSRSPTWGGAVWGPCQGGDPPSPNYCRNCSGISVAAGKAGGSHARSSAARNECHVGGERLYPTTAESLRWRLDAWSPPTCPQAARSTAIQVLDLRALSLGASPSLLCDPGTDLYRGNVDDNVLMYNRMNKSCGNPTLFGSSFKGTLGGEVGRSWNVTYVHSLGFANNSSLIKSKYSPLGLHPYAGDYYSDYVIRISLLTPPWLKRASRRKSGSLARCRLKGFSITESLQTKPHISWRFWWNSQQNWF